jgi:RNA polymerase sigma-54 factor
MAFTQGLYTDDVTVERMLTVIHELEPSGVERE